VKPGWVLSHANRWRTTQGAAARYLAKANKSARRKGFADAEARLRADAQFAWTIATKMAGLYPAAFVALAAQLVFGADAADAGGQLVAAEGRVMHLSALSAPKYEEFIYYIGFPTMLFMAALCFMMGCCTGSVCSPFALLWCFARRCFKALVAFTEPLESPNQGATRKRHVGVMSQCTYAWYSSDPRFYAGNQGFRQAGEVSIEEVPE